MMFKNEDGTSVVEFAIIAPLLFVIVFGIIEFGFLLYDKAMLTNASREGAREGIVFSDPRVSNADIEDVVKEYCDKYLIPPPSAGRVLNVNISRSGTGTSAGDDLTVNVTYPYRFLVLSNVLGLLGGGFADTVNLNAVTIMRME